MFASRSRRKHTERGLDRFINFSDAVIAIAITLVALPLVDVAQHDTVTGFFRDDAYGIVAAAISFASIAGFWRDHHRLFERATDYSVVIIRLGFVWLASIVFLPVAAVLLVGAPAAQENAALALYLGTLCLTIAILNVEELELLRLKAIPDEDRPGRLQLVARWLPVLLRLIALVAAIVLPPVHLWALLLLIVNFPVQTLLDRRRKPAAS